jgi:hypothetical protein
VVVVGAVEDLGEWRFVAAFPINSGFAVHPGTVDYALFLVYGDVQHVCVVGHQSLDLRVVLRLEHSNLS